MITSRGMRRRLPLLFLLLAACAAGPRELVRDDWVVTPAKPGPSQVLTREAYVAKVRAGELKRAGSLGKRPPDLLDAKDLTLAMDEVRSFMLEDARVKRLRLEGRSAEVFWTKPYELRRRVDGEPVALQASDVHVKGVAEGTSRLVIDLADGGERVLTITVSAPRS